MRFFVTLYEKIVGMFAEKGITIPADKVDEIKQSLSDMKLEGLPADTSKMSDAQLVTAINAMTETVKTIQKQLSDETEARKAIAEQLSANEKASKSARIKALLDEAVKNEKITPDAAKFSEVESEKGVYQKRLEKDFDEWSSEILTMKGKAVSDDGKSGDKHDPKKDDKTPETEGLLSRYVNPAYLDQVTNSSK